MQESKGGQRRLNWVEKLRQWEYWPFHYVYGPIYIIFVWYVIRSGFRFFFTASNPSIENGGFVLESKKQIYDMLPPNISPETLYFDAPHSPEIVLDSMAKSRIKFPCMLKPDIGGRGRGVVILENEAMLRYYVSKYTLPFLIQEFVAFEQEAGIFYCKYPDQPHGFVSGIVGKGFGTVTGNGVDSIGSLILKDERLSLYYDSITMQLGSKTHEVLKHGVVKMLMPFGNHARGAAFYDWAHLIDTALMQWIDPLMKQVPDFHYGRLDIRFNTWEELLAGKNFSIIELNGAGSEPTHIYDSKHSLWFAWKEIIRHWRILFTISRQQRKKGFPSMSVKDGLKMLKANSIYEDALNDLHLSLLKTPDKF